MSTTRTCPVCGAALSDDVLGGRCPRCVAQLALGTHVRYFGDYELLEEIGRGGMGVVYKARQLTLNRNVAVKMLLHGDFASEEFIKRFQVEAEAAASLQHPNIVAIHEIGVHEGRHYFSMDLVEGSSLAELVRSGPLAPDRAARYVRTMAEAIHYAHQRGVLHRDLKPSNVLIDSLDQPRITDFGLAKRLDAPFPGGAAARPVAQVSSPAGSGGVSPPESGGAVRISRADLHLTLTGQVLGAPSYMPPEHASGKRGESGAPSDVYALGALLYHLLTGQPPFLAETLPQTLLQVQTQNPAPPRQLNPAIPRDLETICLKCLQKDPRQRYATAAALADDLRRWQAGEPIFARRTRFAERTWRASRRHPALATISLLAVLGLVAAAVFWPRLPPLRIPPDVTEIIIVSDTSDSRAGQLCVTEPGGSFWHPLPIWSSIVDVSPDGQRLCFVRPEGTNSCSVWVCQLDGRAQQQIVMPGMEPLWLDNHTLAYQPLDHLSLWAVDIESRKVRKLFDWSAITPRGHSSEPRVSPDRRRLLCNPQNGARGDTADVFVCDLNGKNVRVVWEDAEDPLNQYSGTGDHSLLWLDNERVAWCRHARPGYRVTDTAIVSCRVGETNFTALTAWKGYNYPLALSPDSRRLLYATEDNPGLGRPELWTMNLDGTSKTNLPGMFAGRKFSADFALHARWISLRR